jgi:hypothetical protein
MAGLAHMGVGLAAKPLAPKVPVGVLVLSAYAIDIVWGVFVAAGIERLPQQGKPATKWSHSLLTSTVCSVLAAAVAALVSRRPRTGALIGLLVFSHWVVDFISHPMKAVFPEDTGLPLLFEGSPTVGLGVWSTHMGVTIGEYGTFLLGLVVYVLTRLKLAKESIYLDNVTFRFLLPFAPAG